MHDEIVRFKREGHTSNNAQNRAWAIRDLEVEMRDKGFVPCVDLNPQYTVDFINDEKGFWFQLSVYGVFVGRKDACEISGVTNGTTITKHTPRVR